VGVAARAKERLAQLKQLLSLAGAGDRRDGDGSELPDRAESAARPISTGGPKANVQLDVSTEMRIQKSIRSLETRRKGFPPRLAP
jgi:hypothetical protein